MLIRSVIFFINFIVSFNDVYCGYMGTVESLRQNIEKLMKGKLIFSDHNLPYDESELSDTTPKNQSEYDLIVIGAGSAGAVVASRLSEVPNTKVLLIEAGTKEYSIADIPLMATNLQFSDQINWKYQTESSDRFCLGLSQNRSHWVRGKVTGGSSVLNFMLATRGNKKDYDNWASETADDSWSYHNMLQYLKKLENCKVNNVELNDTYRSKNGPMYITSPPYNTKLGETFMQAGKELGYSVDDYNGAKQAGFSYFQSTIYEGERWSTNRGYLRTVKNRQNLIFTRDSFVEKILIDGETKRAFGVRFSKYGRMIEVRARREIILSAGAINSPQILMLSGVGPAKHLRELNITVIKDAPVGKNLMDHIAYGGLIFKVNDSSTYSSLSLLDPKNKVISEYITSRKGPLAHGSGFESLAYVNVDNPNSMDEHPNIELLFGGLSGMKDPLLSQALNVNKKYRDIMQRDQFNHSAWTVWPMIMKPRSRGQILLRSNNPYDKPKIYPNYLDHPEDVRVMIKGIRMVLKLSRTNAFRKYGSELYQVPLPCQNFEFDSDAYWECALRTYTYTIYHPSGTCKMGLKNSTSSVVDPQLNVIGVKGLKVVDASIMPTIVSAHPNIPIIAIAEKISDEIKKLMHARDANY